MIMRMLLAVVSDARASQIPDIDINSTIKHFKRLVHKVIVIALRAP